MISFRGQMRKPFTHRTLLPANASFVLGAEYFGRYQLEANSSTCLGRRPRFVLEKPNGRVGFDCRIRQLSQR